MTPEQRGAAIVALQAQLEGIQAALDAARATLAILSMDAETELDELDELDEPDPRATDDPLTCGHPVWLNVDGGGGNTQRLCDSCGLNLST